MYSRTSIKSKLSRIYFVVESLHIIHLTPSLSYSGLVLKQNIVRPVNKYYIIIVLFVYDDIIETYFICLTI